MRTIICTFVFPDGATASAALKAEAPEDTIPISYGGALDRLPDRLRECSFGTLAMWAKQAAEKTSAKLTIDQGGFFDIWAE